MNWNGSGVDFGKSSYLVPCGKCAACLRKRQNEWAIRLLLEERCSDVPAQFVTITYEDSHLPVADEQFSLDKSAIPTFIHRLRSRLDRKYGFDEKTGKSLAPQIKFFGAGEYGDQFSRPH